MVVLRLGNLLGGQADGGDLIGKCDGPSQVQQSDVTVQIFLPVVFGMDDDFINCYNLLNATFKPGKLRKYSQSHSSQSTAKNVKKKKKKVIFQCKKSFSPLTSRQL